MPKKRSPVGWALAGGWFVAGILGELDFSKTPSLNTLFFCVPLLIYSGLILYWIQAVRRRMLPTRERAYILSSAALMILFLMLRAMKYRISSSRWEQVYWYAYYVPLTLIPTLFLMMALRLYRGKSEAEYGETALLIPAALLAATVLANDWHHGAFLPDPAVEVFIGISGTYAYGPLFYVVWGWIVGTFILGVAVLVRANQRRHSHRAAIQPILLLLDMLLLFLVLYILDQKGIHSPWRFPEICIIGMLGIFESCIQSRLMPSNENYSGFFRSMTLPAAILDGAFSPVYQTEEEMRSGRAEMEKALAGPVYLKGDIRLSGKRIRAGYAFWEEDESNLRRLNEKMEEANEILAAENTLIRAENQLKEQKARLESHSRIYGRIAEALYPTHQKITALLSSTAPGAADFRHVMAVCCVLNAYVKRKSNLLLMAGGTEKVDGRELYLALQESARYLHFCGVEAAVAEKSGLSFSLDDACDLYDAFEMLIENYLPLMKKLTVYLMDSGLRLAMDCGDAPPPPPGKTPLDVVRSEGLLYLTVTAKGGGAP